MQFEVTKQSLLKAISNVSGAVERKNTIPVLQNIKIEAQKNNYGDRVVLSATDMDILVTSAFEADIKTSGVTTVPAQMFFDIVRKIPEGAILLSQESPTILQIKAGKSKYSLPCIDASEFPNLSEGELGEEIEIKSEVLVTMIDKTRFAISSDETRYYLNGLYLHASSQGLRTVATDGHRLALAFTDLVLKTPFGVILPKKSVAEICKIVEGASQVKFAISRVKIKLVADQTMIVSKLIDGEFPDYDKVLPKNNSHVAVINKKIFFDAVDRVSTVATDRHRLVKMVVENGKATLQVSTNDGSFAHEEFELNYAGEPIETGFNSRYLLDIISQVDGDELLMRFKDGSSPALIEAKGMSAVFVIMPVRI
ncbi:MAG: DNA polymerase III subunit beta [Alphaproteobacteria bacterium]|nr:DNA polymerase III subunit beta [Alphaproteobacteria bacterium]